MTLEMGKTSDKEFERIQNEAKKMQEILDRNHRGERTQADDAVLEKMGDKAKEERNKNKH